MAACTAMMPFTGHAAQAATLLGDEVSVGYRVANEFGTLDWVDIVTVGDMPEIDCTSPGFEVCELLFGTRTIDLGENTISFTWDLLAGFNLFDLPFNGWRFTDLDFGAGIGSVSLMSFGFTGLDESDIAFKADSIFLNMAGVEKLSGESIWTLTLTEIEPSVVPLPASLPLALAGLGALLVLRRRR
jgi:hypothetical protein